MSDVGILELSQGVRVEMDQGLDRDEAVKVAAANLEVDAHHYNEGRRLAKEAKLRTAKKFKLKAPKKSEFDVPGSKTKTLASKIRAKAAKFMAKQQ